MRKVCLLFLLLSIGLMLGCQRPVEKEEMSQVTGNSVQELKTTACDAADEAGTCETRLPELGFITKEECCELFKKCC